MLGRAAAIAVLIFDLGLGLKGMAQSAPPKLAAKPPAADTVRGPGKQLTPEQKFVVDTVKMAVALPESDQQDRLRVLSTAADVISTIDKRMAKSFWTEGVNIESELVRLGETPAVSMMANGQGDCSAVESFVENLPDNAALRAEQAFQADAGLGFTKTGCRGEQRRGAFARPDGYDAGSRGKFPVVTGAFRQDVCFAAG